MGPTRRYEALFIEVKESIGLMYLLEVPVDKHSVQWCLQERSPSRVSN